MKYRPEIDGLRAVAVVPVILFHAGFSTFSGGFVGVDVFFVISGFLITSIILREVEAGQFSFWGFYERRARRILPALFFVVICCIPFAWLWMMPREMQDFAVSVRAVSLFISNLWFWQKSGYFDQASELKPLLHTWSLAVEEQFYILFPPAILLLWRLGRRNTAVAIALVAVASLALSEYASRFHPSFNFYWLPTRAWELMAGALCVFAAIKPGRLRDDLLSAIGLAAIVFAIFYFDSSTPFPSLYALAPVLGTCAIILFCRPGTLAFSLLSSRLLVGLGLISYSAYLWHQPIFAFARLRLLSEPPQMLMALLAILSVALAWLSWRFIEVPARRRGAWPLPTRKAVFTNSAATAAVLVAFGFAGVATKGFPGRLPGDVALLANYENDENPRKNCMSKPGREIAPGQACVYGNEAKVAVALLGDSHAHAIAFELGKALQAQSLGLKELTHSGCPPIGPYVRMTEDGLTDCGESHRSAVDYLRNQAGIDVVVLFARWPLYDEFTRFNNGEGGVERGERVFPLNTELSGGSEAEVRARVGALYQNTITELADAGKRVVVVYPQPEIGWDVPTQVPKIVMFGDAGMRPLSVSLEGFRQRSAFAYSQLDAVKHDNVARVLPERIFCDTVVKGRCAAEDGKEIYYNDDDHLSSVGASMLSQAIVRAMEERGWLTP